MMFADEGKKKIVLSVFRGRIFYLMQTWRAGRSMFAGRLRGRGVISRGRYWSRDPRQKWIK
jgi:hypothetical protein